MLLSKGFEVEMYTGRPDGTIVGLSDQIVADLNGFVREPDSRNVEYTTPPLCRYEQLLCELVRPRQALRRYLAEQGDFTIVPGSSLSLGDSSRFFRSDPSNPYHGYIEQTYGATVVTASIHINIGIPEPEALMRACRLVRLEAPLFLALTASSPFLDGAVTGYHSSRWSVFPKTPTHVPLFESHAHHIQWVEQQLSQGSMQNVRHLWSSVRPNGDRRPYNLNRLELRICDLVSDPLVLLAITALLETRILQLLADPSLDPLVQPHPYSPTELVALTDDNEMAAARDSLDAKLCHWQDGRTIVARDWIEELYHQAKPLAQSNGISCFLSPIRTLLDQGNEAQRWLSQYQQGLTPAEILTAEISAVEGHEASLAEEICQPCAA